MNYLKSFTKLRQGITEDVAGEGQVVSNAKVMWRLNYSEEYERSEKARKMLSCKSYKKKHHMSCLKAWAHDRGQKTGVEEVQNVALFFWRKDSGTSWIQWNKDKRNPSEYWAIEMIMLDEQEDACLLIHKPSLGLNPAKFKFVDKPNKINLVYATKISTGTNFLGPPYGFSFASFANITNNQYPESLTIVGTSQLPQRCTLCFQLFWICCFQIFFINDDVNEIAEYRKSLVQKCLEYPKFSHPPYGISNVWTLEEDFLINTPFTNVGEICEIEKFGT
ncbi:hypothetical protein QVD17_08890 [Tagetes erecta]|uniref:Uncharacterized protein n=1 Tax=Tagetes erecta TaxID=13708 RepID=A0AAD8P4H8_TARER|nr:hypothetical protein QVD17_08890 [Tagetes erecta]